MLRVGVVGYGYWGPNVARNFDLSERACVAGVADLSHGRRLQARRRGFKTTSDPESLFADADIDAVAIVTPVSTHFKLAKAALLAGKHVLIEKPLASSGVEAAELEALAQERGLVLMVDHTFIYTGAVREIKRRLPELGKLNYFDSVRVNLGLCQPDIDVIWDLAPHDLSILFHLVDEKPTSVTATGADHVGQGRASMAHISLAFASGLMAHMHVNWLSPVKVRRTLIGGARRMAVYDDVEPTEKVRIYDKGIDCDPVAAMVDYRVGDMCAPKLDTTEALAVEVEHFIDCTEGATSISGAAEGIEVVRVLEAASGSLQRGETIRL